MRIRKPLLMALTAALLALPAAEAYETWANWSTKISASFKKMKGRKIPGRTMGLLVPSDNREDILPLSAAAYNVLRRGDFHTVIILMQAPKGARVEGLAVPITSAFETSFGRFAVDTTLRDKLMDGEYPILADDALFPIEAPETLQRQLAYLKFIFRGDAVRLRILPVFVSFEDPNSQVKDYAPFLVDQIRDHGVDADLLVIAVANLTRADSAQRLHVADGTVLRAVRNLDADALLEWERDAEGASLPDRDALVMALLTMRWSGADHAEILAYGDSGRLLLTKDRSRPLSFAAAGFASAPPVPPRIPHVDQEKMLLIFDDAMRTDVLTMTRQACASALDATAAKPPPLGHKEARRDWPVYVSILDAQGTLLGRAGSHEATGPLEESLRRYAVEAVRRASPRLTRASFKTCVIDVSVPFGFNRISTPDDLIPLLNGVVLKQRRKAAAMHPDAWRTFPDAHQLAAEASHQLDLPPWGYATSSVKMDSFRVLAFNEKEPFPAMISPDRKRKKGRGAADELPDDAGGSSGGGPALFGF